MAKVNFFKVPPNCSVALSITTRFGSVAEFKGYWIGVDTKSYVICRISSNEGNSGLNVIGQDCEVNVRLHWNGNLVGFNSRIVNLINEPAKWMILSYPQNVMCMPLRKQDRYECYQEGRLHLDSKYVLKGVIKDISQGGCKFIPKLTQKFNIDVLKGKSLQLQTHFPKRKDPIFLTGIVRNTPEERNEFALGLQFVEEYPEVNQQIEFQLVNKQLEKQLNEGA